MTTTLAKIPLMDLKQQYLSLRGELVAAATRVMDSGVFILGPEGAAFEREFGAAHDAPHCAGVSSGTSALQLALEACGVGPGDEVAVPAFTFIATATVVSALGAKPVLVDVDPATPTMDPKDLAARLTPKTKAVVPVHLFGRPADMGPILAVAKERGLRVVEDCAQGHLARYGGRCVGSLGDCGAFSFYPSKNLGAMGDAGALTTADPKLQELFIMLRNVGRKPGGHYEHVRVGHNCRLDELQAAVLRVKLPYLAAWTEAKRKSAELYRRALAGLPLRLPPEDAPGMRQVYTLFVIQADRRDALSAHLTKAGIGNGVYYPAPLHRMPAYQHLGLGEGSLPRSEAASRAALALPMYAELTEESIGRIADSIRSFYQG